MKARIVILPDGTLSIYVDEGSYEEGAAKIGAIVAALKAQGATFASVGQTEQHRHEPGQSHTHAQKLGQG